MTDQRFTNEAVDCVWEQTRGHPWLVSAIGRQCVETVPDRSTPVEARHVGAAIRQVEGMGLPHLASLSVRVANPRLQAVLSSVIRGSGLEGVPEPSIRFAHELGLVAGNDDGAIGPANPIYARVFLQLLGEPTRYSLVVHPSTWLRQDGTFDPSGMRDGFRAFWSDPRRHGIHGISQPGLELFVLFAAWLGRVARTSVGTVVPGYAAAAAGLDLLFARSDLRLPVRLMARPGDRDPVDDGLDRVDGTCARHGANTGVLVIFDQRTGATGTRLECEEVVTEGGRTVTVIWA